MSGYICLITGFVWQSAYTFRTGVTARNGIKRKRKKQQQRAISGVLPNLQTRTRANRSSTLYYHIIQDTSHTSLIHHRSYSFIKALLYFQNFALERTSCRLWIMLVAQKSHFHVTSPMLRKVELVGKNWRFEPSTKAFCLGGGRSRSETALLVGKPPNEWRPPSRFIWRRD